MPIQTSLRHVGFLAVACAGFVASTAALAYTGTAHLTLQSQPGDFVGAGQNKDISYDGFFVSIRRTLSNGDPGELIFLGGTVTSSNRTNTYATLFFGTDALGIPIQPGTYNNAQRADYASPGHPGLDVSFQNRGSSTISGDFTIQQVTFFSDPLGNVQVGNFSATFEQHSEGNTPALFGTFVYHGFGAPVPEPGSVAMLVGMGLSVAGFFARRRKTARQAA